MRISDNEYELNHQIHKTLSFIGYIGKYMKNESDFLLMTNILNDLGYTGIGDRDSKRNLFFKNLFQN